jgi:hypothetical protein
LKKRPQASGFSSTDSLPALICHPGSLLSLLSEETATDPMDSFSSVDIVALFPCGTISPDARFRALKELLMDRSDEIREARYRSRQLFSVTHFTALLESACEHFATNSSQPFDYIRASRSQNPVAKDLDQHISTFLQSIKTPGELVDFAAPVLGSSLLLDNYLPENHCKIVTPICLIASVLMFCSIPALGSFQDLVQRYLTQGKRAEGNVL